MIISRFLEGVSERRDGRSSCVAVSVRVVDGAGGNMGWVLDVGATEAIPCGVAHESSGVACGGVAASVNQRGWYRFRARVARMRWRVLRCVWGCLMIFHSMCGA